MWCDKMTLWPFMISTVENRSRGTYDNCEMILLDNNISHALYESDIYLVITNCKYHCIHHTQWPFSRRDNTT